MVIKNETKKTILSDNAIIAKSFIQKTFGLILEKKADAMIFQTRFGIHTFFMKYPIDVLILDKQKRVVKMKVSLKPNSIYLWNPKFETVIELTEETIQKTKTEFFDHISY